MGRDENVIVFKDTENLCKTNPRILEAVKRSTSAQKLILEGDALAEQKKDLYEDAVNVIKGGAGWENVNAKREPSKLPQLTRISMWQSTTLLQHQIRVEE